MLSKAKFFHRFGLFEIVQHRSESTISAYNRTYSLRFFDEKVQELLKKVTNVDLEKVFQARPRGKPLKAPTYKFMTTKQLEEEVNRFIKKADHLLQIPPLVTPKDIQPVKLAEDPGIDYFDEHYSKLVFTDTSWDLKNEEREIVVREPNGVLRTASGSERFRMNQIYYPLKGREIEMPKMFEEENLQKVIEREDYLFILDRACIQFDPEDPMYHNVIELTYNAINDKGHYSKLYSTRHFGSLVFYLISHKRIDDLLIYTIKSGKIDDACDLIQIYQIIHPDCSSAKKSIGKTGKDKIEIVKDFINCDALKKSALELELENYLKEEQEKAELASTIKETQEA